MQAGVEQRRVDRGAGLEGVVGQGDAGQRRAVAEVELANIAEARAVVEAKTVERGVEGGRFDPSGALRAEGREVRRLRRAGRATQGCGHVVAPCVRRSGVRTAERGLARLGVFVQLEVDQALLLVQKDECLPVNKVADLDRAAGAVCAGLNEGSKRRRDRQCDVAVNPVVGQPVAQGGGVAGL